MELQHAKVTTKGQVTLPKRIRESLKIQTGDRLAFSVDAANIVSVRKMQTAGSSAGCGQRFLQGKQKPLNAEESKAAIRQHMLAKYGKPSK